MCGSLLLSCPTKPHPQPPTTSFFVFVLNQRRRLSDKDKEYLVRWEDYGPAEDSWEPRANINNPSLVDAFDAAEDRAREAMRHVAGSGGGGDGSGSGGGSGGGGNSSGKNVLYKDVAKSDGGGSHGVSKVVLYKDDFESSSSSEGNASSDDGLGSDVEYTPTKGGHDGSALYIDEDEDEDQDDDLDEELDDASEDERGFDKHDGQCGAGAAEDTDAKIDATPRSTAANGAQLDHTVWVRGNKSNGAPRRPTHHKRDEGRRIKRAKRLANKVVKQKGAPKPWIEGDNHWTKRINHKSGGWRSRVGLHAKPGSAGATHPSGHRYVYVNSLTINKPGKQILWYARVSHHNKKYQIPYMYVHGRCTPPPLLFWVRCSRTPGCPKP